MYIIISSLQEACWVLSEGSCSNVLIIGVSLKDKSALSIITYCNK